jgi:hypothetical protein
MSEQLEQVDEPVIQDEQPTIENLEAGTAPDSGEDHDKKVVFDENQQKVFDQMAAQKAFEVREAKRNAEQLKEQLEAAQAQIPAEVRPEVPDLPDPYDDNYQQALAQRDEAIRASANFDAKESLRAQQAQDATIQKQKEQQEVLTKTVDDYAQRATKLGVNAQELQVAGGIVSQYGIDEQVVMHILNDEQGPLITKYLSQNPLAMETIRQSDPMSAAVYINNEIRQKASALGVREPTAPDPVETLSGAGVAPGERGPKGATFT